MFDSTRRTAAALVFVAAIFSGCGTPEPPARAPVDEAARAALVPTGTLRIAVYSGSPTSMVKVDGEPRGLSVEVGRVLAHELDVPSQLVEFDRVEQVVDAVRNGRADMTITNATATRAAWVDFTSPLVALELGYLVMPGSPVATIGDVDRAGVRIGVSQGSTSQSTLGRALHQASLVPAPSLKDAAQLLRDHRIDAFATNKAILHQMGDGLPGSRVLEGRWGAESLAIAVPKGREAGHAWLEGFAERARTSGLVRRAADRAGLRGLAAAEKP